MLILCKSGGVGGVFVGGTSAALRDLPNTFAFFSSIIYATDHYKFSSISKKIMLTSSIRSIVGFFCIWRANIYLLLVDGLPLIDDVVTPSSSVLQFFFFHMRFC